MLTILNNFIVYLSLRLFRRKRQALLCSDVTMMVSVSAPLLVTSLWSPGKHVWWAVWRYHTWPRLSPNDDQVWGVASGNHYLQLPIVKSLIPLSACVIHVSLHCCCSLDLVYTWWVRAVWQLQPSVQRWPGPALPCGQCHLSSCPTHQHLLYNTSRHLNISTSEHLNISTS